MWFSYWFDYLGIITEGNTYATLFHHPFLFKGKPTQCSRGSKKDFWRLCRGVYAQVKQSTYTCKSKSVALLESANLPSASSLPSAS